MGHLVNPIAFRLGWTRNWIDDFFVELRFYPELIHRLLRFRFFLNCFFSTTITSSLYFNHYLISHFSFYLHSKGFGLQIFYYNSRIDLCWYDFFEKISQKPFGIKFFPKKWDQPPAFSPWNRKCFALLFYLYYFASAVNRRTDFYNFRLPFFRAFESTIQSADFAALLYRLKYKYYRIKQRNVTPSEQQAFFVLHLLRLHSLQEIGRLSKIFRGRGLRLINYEFVAHNFFRLIFVYHTTKPYMTSFGRWLRFLGQSFFLQFPLAIRFYQVNNEQLSSRFLAKFLAIRFTQGYTVRSIINPIRRDLRIAKKFSGRIHHKVMAIERTLKPLERRDFSLFISLIRFTLNFLNKMHLHQQSYWDFSQFFLAFQSKPINFRLFFAKHGRRKKNFRQRKFRSFRRSLLSTKKISFCAALYRFHRLFFEKQFFYHLALHFSNLGKQLFFFFKLASAFFLDLSAVIFSNYENSIAGHSTADFVSFRGLSPIILFYLSGAALRTFLQFSFFSASPKRINLLLNTHQKTHRSFVPPAYGLCGFRIRLHGRFTRKQIASAYHFQEGGMPLSTLNVSVDYGFATVPIRNSAVGVKVWLYRRGLSFIPSHDYTYITD